MSSIIYSDNMHIFQKLLDYRFYWRDRNLSLKAISFIKENCKIIIEKYAGHAPKVPKNELAIAFFMAGSPGAGKTEFSKNLIKVLKNLGKNVVRIDADEVREELPKDIYTGKNSHVVQKAASRGVYKLYDHVLQKNKHFVLDGTFSDLAQSEENIRRAIKKNRLVEIWYLYQDPQIAWDFTQKREIVEGRRIRKKDFINAFFEAKNNVNIVKKKFGKKVKLNVAIKDYTNEGLEKLFLDVQSVDSHLKMKYNRKSLSKLI